MRQHDAPPDPKHVCAVDDCGLGDLLGDRLHVVAEHKRGKARLKDDMDEHDPDVLVVEQVVITEERKYEFAEVELTEHRNRRVEVDAEEGHDDDLRRQKVARGEDHQGGQVEAPAELRAGKGDHRGQEQGQHHGGDRDHQGVEVVVRQLGLGPERLVVRQAQSARWPRQIAVLDGVTDRSQGRIDGPEEREDPHDRHGDQERVEDYSPGSKAARSRGLLRAHPCSGRDRAHDCVLMTRDRKTTIWPSEITSKITAMAEPKPTRLASLMLLLVIRIESSSRPFLPWLMMKAMSKARRASMAVMTTTTMLMGAMTGKTTRKNVCTSLAPSTLAASRSVGSTLFNPAR